MAVFPSDEWISIYEDRINGSPEYREAAASWEGAVAFVFEAEPDRGVPTDLCAFLDLWHGECREAKMLGPEEGQRAPYVIRAPYSRWKEVVRGDLDPVKGMMQGKLKLQGDLAMIVRYVRAANELVHLTMQVPTEFLDERPTAASEAVRAVVFREPGRVEVADVREPELVDPRDAIVRVSLSAICGSDLHFLHAKTPLEPGETMGHEAVGVVERAGTGVTRVAVGERVVAAFTIACGACWFCERGQSQLCEDARILGAGLFGGSLGGAQAELVRIPNADVNLLSVPQDVEDERAIFVGDVLSSGYHAAEIASIRPGETVAIVGAGPLGNLVAQAALLHGPSEVISIDLEPGRLALAADAGAVPVNATQRNPHTAVSERTGGRGADVVIEAVGTPAAFGRALDVVRRGGRVIVVGVFASEVFPAQLGVWWARALDVRFTGVCPVHAVWREAMTEVARGRIDPLPLVSHRLPLEEAPKGYELFDRREASKVLLRP